MKTKLLTALVTLTAILFFTGCASVDVIKTAKGFHAPTNPNDIEILMTRPDREYEELGTIDASNFRRSATAKMQNALRAKAAPLGANAVIITSQGQFNSNSGIYQWADAVAIAWK